MLHWAIAERSRNLPLYAGCEEVALFLLAVVVAFLGAIVIRLLATIEPETRFQMIVLVSRTTLLIVEINGLRKLAADAAGARAGAWLVYIQTTQGLALLWITF